MAFFKRKEVKKIELPDLPGMPLLPELPPLPETSPSRMPEASATPLPSFPNTPAGDSMSFGAIKSSINEAPYPRAKEFEFRKIDLGEKRTLEMPSSIQPEQKPPALSRQEFTPREQPVFIKLEKFQDAVKKFEEVKLKVEDIGDALKKIRGLKDREEVELKSWEAELQAIKEKVSNIDSSLFSRI